MTISFVGCMSMLSIRCICQHKIDCCRERCILLRSLQLRVCFVTLAVLHTCLLTCTSNGSIKDYLLLLCNWFLRNSFFSSCSIGNYTRDCQVQGCSRNQHNKINLQHRLSNASSEWAYALLVHYEYFSVKNPRTLLGLSDQVSVKFYLSLSWSNLLFCRLDADSNVDKIACALLEDKMRTLGAKY